MLIPTLTLLAQTGGIIPQVSLRDVHVSESAQGVEVRALAREIGNTPSLDAWILEPDATGRLVRAGALEGGVMRYDNSPALGRTRAVGRDPLGRLRVWERGAGGWTLGPDLGLSTVAGPTAPTAVRADVDDGRSVVWHRIDELLVIHDLRTPGQAILEASFPAGMPRYIVDLAIDGDFVVLLEGDLPHLNLGLLGDLEIRVLERTAAGWVDRGTVDPPPGIDWDRAGVRSIDADAGYIAVGAQFGPSHDPCGRVVVYERNAAGAYVLDEIVRPTEECLLAPERPTQFGWIVDLGGDELAVTRAFDYVGQRYERSASGWIAQERVIAANTGPYFAFDGRLIGGSYGGIEVLEPTDSFGVFDVACPGLVDGTRSLMFVSNRSTISGEPRYLDWFVDPYVAGLPHLFVVGTTEARRPLGPAAELCVGGSIRMAEVVASQWTWSATVEIDLSGLGVPAGTTMWVQGWRREPGVVGGLTSNAFRFTTVP